MIFRCLDCYKTIGGWQAQCPACKGWRVVSTDDEITFKELATDQPVDVSKLQTIADTPATKPRIMPTLVKAFDLALGGGLAVGTVTLLTGDPGIGKSTLLLQLLNGMAAQNMKCAYFSAEESAERVTIRARRIGLGKSKVLLHYSENLEEIIQLIESENINAAVIDSIQAIESVTIDYTKGSISQVRECMNRLVGAAQTHDVTLVIVCHVTADGSLAGPRTIEHAADAVVYLEAEQESEESKARCPLVTVYAQKNRNGPIQEKYQMRMTKGGLVNI